MAYWLCWSVVPLLVVKKKTYLHLRGSVYPKAMLDYCEDLKKLVIRAD